MKRIIISLLLLPSLVFAQNYDGFVIKNLVPHTSVKDQQRTGSCWVFSTVSFIEAEALRITGKKFDLSEMYVLYYSYIKKAIEYLRWQGKTQFSTGGLGHDVLNIVREYGIVPEKDYPFTISSDEELIKQLKEYLDSILTMDTVPDNWLIGYKKILNKYMPVPPQKIIYNGKKISPKYFLFNILHFDPNQYFEFTSFRQSNYYYPFVLEIPDNWAKAAYWNIPLSNLYNIALNSLKQGYSFIWDGDVTEPGFNQSEAVAYLTDYQKQQAKKFSFVKYRQILYERHKTQDDHLMHIVGLAQKDKKFYFYVKNSWGAIGPLKGYLYMSSDYFMLKTISILVNKAVIPKEIRERLYKFDCQPVDNDEKD